MSGGATERVVTRVRGRGRRVAEDQVDYHANLLALCELVQQVTHPWARGA